MPRENMRDELKYEPVEGREEGREAGVERNQLTRRSSFRAENICFFSSLRSTNNREINVIPSEETFQGRKKHGEKLTADILENYFDCIAGNVAIDSKALTRSLVYFLNQQPRVGELARK